MLKNQIIEAQKYFNRIKNNPSWGTVGIEWPAIDIASELIDEEVERMEFVKTAKESDMPLNEARRVLAAELCDNHEDIRRCLHCRAIGVALALIDEALGSV